MRARRLGKPGPIDKRQIVKIHVLIARMILPDSEYRAILRQRFNVDSSTELNYLQAEDLISGLKVMGEQMGFWEKSPDGERYNELGNRPGMASSAQLRMVESIWSEVTKPETEEKRDETLRRFLFKFFKVSHMKFLDLRTVSKVLYTLKEMQQREKAKPAEDATQCALE